MNLNLRKPLLQATLAGALILGAGAAPVLAQNPDEPPPGSRADQREDRHEARQLRANIQGDQERFQSDAYQFGNHSPQARADRRQLRQDRERLKRLRRDQQRDQRIRDGNGWR